MAVMQLVKFSVLSGMATSAGHQECDAVCASLDACDKGTYCKYWDSPATCFGLYHNGDLGYCYQPNDPQCPTTNPVMCNGTETTVTNDSSPVDDPTTLPTQEEQQLQQQVTQQPTEQAVVDNAVTPKTTTDSSVPNSCQAICNSVSSCANDPHAHGSYCKSDKNPQVCFGLYVTSSGGICFQPNDPSCDERVPVRCPILAAAETNAIIDDTTVVPS